MRRPFTLLFVVAALVLAGWSLWPAPASPPITQQSDLNLKRAADQLRPLHRKLPDPQPGDWLAQHDERGQTFAQYLAGKSVTARGQRNVLYVLPLGEFNEEQRRIVTLTAEFLGLYFGLKVKTLPDISLDLIPDEARRTHPTWGVKQILSTYVLHDLLPPRLPDDAAALIALTSSDLWPGQGWNFVFGQATLQDRVGVWSLHRFGNPTESKDAFRDCLLRTLKVASHETGHMFSMRHCTAFLCNMCGSNHMQETDAHPLALCPECLPKLWHATGVDPATRFDKLAAFCREHRLDEAAAFYQQSRLALAGKLPAEAEAAK